MRCHAAQTKKSATNSRKHTDKSGLQRQKGGATKKINARPHKGLNGRTEIDETLSTSNTNDGARKKISGNREIKLRIKCGTNTHIRGTRIAKE